MGSSPDPLRRWVGRRIAQQQPAPPAWCGLYPLAEGRAALAARLALAAAARESLDLQSYIYDDDVSGRLLAAALLQAADRGVRVRVLLDDLPAETPDVALLALDAHPAIEIRLFNPFRWRRLRLLDGLSDFRRLNRRMHNKQFTADRCVTIVGGRNIGDEYFDAAAGFSFFDLDVLAIGPVAVEAAACFDAYWRSGPAVPVTRVATPRRVPPLDRVRELLHRHHQERSTELVAADPRATLDAWDAGLVWAEAHVVADPPQKIAAAGEAEPAPSLADGLRRDLLAARSEVDLVSGYFVPGSEGVATLAALAGRGVYVRVVTNSLASTDVAAVHVGYSRARKPLLLAGVEMWELRPRARVGGRRRWWSPRGSSRASLHTKTYALDRETLFIGSLNLDPRSVTLNTEMGIVLRSAELTATMRAGLDAVLPEAAWRLELEGDDLIWTAVEDGQPARRGGEPEASLGRRLLVGALRALPIEGQL